MTTKERQTIWTMVDACRGDLAYNERVRLNYSVDHGGRLDALTGAQNARYTLDVLKTLCENLHLDFPTSFQSWLKPAQEVDNDTPGMG